MWQDDTEMFCESTAQPQCESLCRKLKEKYLINNFSFITYWTDNIEDALS